MYSRGRPADHSATGRPCSPPRWRFEKVRPSRTWGPRLPIRSRKRRARSRPQRKSRPKWQLWMHESLVFDTSTYSPRSEEEEDRRMRIARSREAAIIVIMSRAAVKGGKKTCEKTKGTQGTKGTKGLGPFRPFGLF